MLNISYRGLIKNVYIYTYWLCNSNLLWTLSVEDFLMVHISGGEIVASEKVIAKKTAIVDEIKNNVETSAANVFFEYHGLTVTELTQLRRELRENDADLKVYKNTLVRRALNELDINLDEELVGPKALAFGKDVVTPVKVLSDFAKKYPALEIKVGIIEGEVADTQVLKELASLPSREGLLTMFAGGLIGTVRNLAIGLDLYSQQKED